MNSSFVKSTVLKKSPTLSAHLAIGKVEFVLLRQYIHSMFSAWILQANFMYLQSFLRPWRDPLGIRRCRTGSPDLFLGLQGSKWWEPCMMHSCARFTTGVFKELRGPRSSKATMMLFRSQANWELFQPWWASVFHHLQWWKTEQRCPITPAAQPFSHLFLAYQLILFRIKHQLLSLCL